MIATADCRLHATLHPSPNIEPRRSGARPDMLLLHYTGMTTCERAIDWLARPQSRVSCHYVVDCDGGITQMVAESMRAWHAGASVWAGITDINSHSIGLEIHNPGHDHGYPAFPAVQMCAVAALATDIVARWGIRPERVLAHSDVAPARKIDPGEKFDWSGLAAAGIGHWVPPAAVDPGDPGLGEGAEDAGVATARQQLASYGYGIAPTGSLDRLAMTVLRAFQRHFRPARVDGRLDRSTLATLEKLLRALPQSTV